MHSRKISARIVPYKSAARRRKSQELRVRGTSLAFVTEPVQNEAFERELKKATAQYGGLATFARGPEWTAKFLRTIAKSRVDTPKFFWPKTIRMTLDELIKVHAHGFRIKKYTGYSEDYNHPDIGEYATPTRTSVTFDRAQFEDRETREKQEKEWERFHRAGTKGWKKLTPEQRAKNEFSARAHDVAFIALSINTPFTIKRRMQERKPDYLANSSDKVPQGPVNLSAFAMQYCKKAGIKNAEDFVAEVKRWYESLNYSNWDHAADHI